MNNTQNTQTQNNVFVWSKEFEVADEKINEQHKSLFNIVNELIEACHSGESKSMLEKALSFLADYVVMHFGYEEYIMDEYNLPNTEDHKRIHDEFKLTALELIKSYKASGASDALSDALNNVVVCWLITHIKGEDIRTFDSLI